jgi:hypothetical protein
MGCPSKLDGVAVGLQAIRQQSGDLVQHPTEVGPSPRFRFVSPQQVHYALPGDGLTLHGQVAQEGQGLAGFKAAHRLSIPLYLHRPQKP